MCSRYFETALLEPKWSMDDAAVATAVKRIRRFIDKRPEILKENMGDEGLHLPLHWAALIKCPLQVVQLIYEKYPEAIENTSCQ
jgi:gamma-glutamyl phosphate reductase